MPNHPLPLNLATALALSQDIDDIASPFKKLHLNNGISLSARELACAKLLLQGKSARLIAQALFLSPRTVETHLKHLKEKLHCHTKTELIGKINELLSCM